MSLINVSNLTFAYGGGENIFENVSFRLDADWRLGFIGRNGKGKTTLLNLLMGKHEYSGTITASVNFEYFPFKVLFEEQNTIDIIYGIDKDFELWELKRELSLLDTDEEILYRPFCELSGGERTKALLSALFLKDNAFPLIDEPTNHLDRQGRETLGKYLQGKKGFILVSHDRSLLDSCTNHILSINRTDIEVQKGGFSSWLNNKRLRDNFELAENERLKKEINKLSDAAKRTSTWSDKIEKTKWANPPDRGFVGHKAAKMMKRSKSIEARKENAAEEKSKLLKNVEKTETLAIKPLDYHTERLLELKEASVYYGAYEACRNISLSVNRGERICLAGGNGSGKSSILKLITCECLSFSGELRLGSGLVISYVPQDTSFLAGGLKAFAEENTLDETLFKAILRKLDFSREQFDKDMRLFSEGQKKKVLIAKSLCEKAHLYIWDEPLNFIDIISRLQIEKLLLAHKPSMIFVEHDAEFVEKIATGIVVL